MNKTYFTAFELILVSVCAVMIAGLTIAAAGSMATDPKTTACANNMRLLEQKLTAWENDNGGHLISQRYCGKLWGRQLLDGGYFDNTGFHPRSVKAYPKRFDCPAETRQRTNGKVNISKPSVNVTQSYDYGLNNNIHLRINEKGKKLGMRADLINPSRIMRMTDSVESRVLNKIQYAVNRHGKGAGNVLHGDGHVKFYDTVPFSGAKGYNRKFWYNVK